jgi:hypothetical protein
MKGRHHPPEPEKGKAGIMLHRVRQIAPVVMPLISALLKLYSTRHGAASNLVATTRCPREAVRRSMRSLGTYRTRLQSIRRKCSRQSCCECSRQSCCENFS